MGGGGDPRSAVLATLRLPIALRGSVAQQNCMTTSESPIRTLLELLADCQLEHLREPLCENTLGLLDESLCGGRPELLKHLKEVGVAKLSDRQALATALAKAKKAGRVEPTADDIPPGVGEKPIPPGEPDTSGARPALICFYSGGLDPAGGRNLLKRWMGAARVCGLTDQLVLDHPSSDAKDWDQFVDGLVAAVEKEFGASRQLLLLGHSLGGLEAFGLAARLGAARVRKLYVIAVRPPTSQPSVLSECFGVSTADGLAKLSPEDFLAKVVEAWSNRLLEEHVGKPASAWPAETRETIELMRRQYSSPSVVGRLASFSPAGTSTSSEVKSLLDIPIMAVAASHEGPKGETADKLRAWRHLTSASFQIASIAEDHFGIMQPGMLNAKKELATPLFSLLLEDILGAKVDQALITSAMRQLNAAKMKTAEAVTAEAVTAEAAGVELS